MKIKLTTYRHPEWKPTFYKGDYDMGYEYEYLYGIQRGIIITWLWFVLEIIDD